MKKGVTILLYAISTLLLFTACGNLGSAPGAQATGGADRPTADREGFPLTLPDRIDTIISLGPSNTEVLVALGFGDMIVATDIFSEDVAGIYPGISNLSVMDPDLEAIIGLDPDIVFITGMARIAGDEDPLRLVSAAGISVVYMPSSTSIEGIKEDIRFMASVLSAPEAGDELVAYMSVEIDRIREIGQTITDRKTVYFEISPAPHLFSFGSQTFLNEMIELVGATNIFADREGWIPVTDEVILQLNPDVILTSVNFLDDPVGEIMDRPGWDSLSAVQNGNIHTIDTASSNRPSHNIILALREIARAVYPDQF